MGNRKFNLQTSQVRMMEKVRLKAYLSYFLSLYCPNNRVENTIFLFDPLQLCRKQTTLSYKK